MVQDAEESKPVVALGRQEVGANRRLDSLRWGLFACAVAVGVGFVTCARASATSLSAIRSRGDQLAAERRTAAGNAEAEKALIERIGEVVLAYVDESDRIQRAGEEDRRRGELRSAFEALHAPLDTIYESRSSRLEKMSRAIMDQDGDLEALYETPEFRDSQVVAASALYYLNWLNYYGARVFEGGRRKELLRRCESGFSQFAVGDHSSELVRESLLGRGLCYLEIGNYEWAQRDFELVLDSSASAERKGKARLALLDTYWRAGNYSRTVSYAKELLGAGTVPSGAEPVIRYYQLQALFELAERSKGAQAKQLRSDAGAVMSKLRRFGRGWSSKVDALMLSRVEDPTEWAGKADSPVAQWQLAQMFLQKEDCTGAEPLLGKVLADDGAVAKRNHGEARYWLGICAFRAQDYPLAASNLSEAIADDPTASFAAEARYFRFKALEARMSAEDPSVELTDLYVASLRDFLDHASDHNRQDEARYRLGEHLQTTGDFAAAVDAYDAVAADADYRLRARFGTLQSRFELLGSERDPARRAELIEAIGEDLEDYARQAAEYPTPSASDGVPLEEFNAKVTLLEAVHASLSNGASSSETAQLLRGFADRFPGQPELAAQASRMRLRALLDEGEYIEAEKEFGASRASLLAEARTDALRSLAGAYAKKGRMSESAADAAAAVRVAVGLYSIAEDAGGEPPGRRQKIAIAQLREKAGDLDAAYEAYTEILASHPKSLAALRGLARVAEARGELAFASEYWVTYTDTVRPGDTGWFRGQYEQARLAQVVGDTEAACKRLTALRTAMPGLQDDEIRQSLKHLFEESGC